MYQILVRPADGLVHSYGLNLHHAAVEGFEVIDVEDEKYHALRAAIGEAMADAPEHASHEVYWRFGKHEVRVTPPTEEHLQAVEDARAAEAAAAEAIVQQAREHSDKLDAAVEAGDYKAAFNLLRAALKV